MKLECNKMEFAQLEISICAINAINVPLPQKTLQSPAQSP